MNSDEIQMKLRLMICYFKFLKDDQQIDFHNFGQSFFTHANKFHDKSKTNKDKILNIELIDFKVSLLVLQTIIGVKSHRRQY